MSYVSIAYQMKEVRASYVIRLPVHKKRDPHFMGGDVNPRTLHVGMRRLYGPADHCDNPNCSRENKKFDWSNKKHDYVSYELSEWQQLCRVCHREYDVTLHHNNDVVRLPHD